MELEEDEEEDQFEDLKSVDDEQFQALNDNNIINGGVLNSIANSEKSLNSSLLHTHLPPPSNANLMTSSVGSQASFNLNSPDIESISATIFKRYCTHDHPETLFASSVQELLKKIASDELVIAEKVKLGYLHSSYEQLYTQNEYLRMEAECYRQLVSAYYPNSSVTNSSVNPNLSGYSSIGFSQPTDPLSSGINTLPMPTGVSYPPVLLASSIVSDIKPPSDLVESGLLSSDFLKKSPVSSLLNPQKRKRDDKKEKGFSKNDKKVRKLFGQCDSRTYKIRRARDYIQELEAKTLREQGASIKEILEYWLEGLEQEEFEKFLSLFEKKISPLKEKWTKEALQQTEQEWGAVLQQMPTNKYAKIKLTGMKYISLAEMEEYKKTITNQFSNLPL